MIFSAVMTRRPYNADADIYFVTVIRIAWFVSAVAIEIVTRLIAVRLDIFFVAVHVRYIPSVGS